MKRTGRSIAFVAGGSVVLVLLLGSAFWLGTRLSKPVPPADVTAAVAPAEPVAAASAPTAVASAAAAATLEMPAASAPFTTADLGPAWADLIGQKAMLAFLQLDDFPRRFVATVDNLSREQAPATVWPVNPTPGRFKTEEREGGALISADNALRYAPFVQFVESVDAARAVDLYLRMYPLLQQAYEDLGFPGRYFNDRLLQVIDQLLATPAATYPIKVHLTEVKGPIPSVRPWVRYQFADPALEALSAGQKILLRVGPVNEHRLKVKLVALRNQLAEHVKQR
jgi:hypothetical protein